MDSALLVGDWGGSSGLTVSRCNGENGGYSGNEADSGPSTELVW